MGRWSAIRSWAIWPYVYWVPPACAFIGHYFDVKVINGRSMQPTLNPNASIRRDVGLFIRDIDPGSSFNRNDIVLLQSPEDPNRVLIKRLVAREGDVVQTLPPYPQTEVVVPQGHVWVEGDEHFWSDDSNRFGPVSESLVQSKLLVLLWPLDRFGYIKDEPPKDIGKRITTFPRLLRIVENFSKKF